MIPKRIVETINTVRFVFQKSSELLKESSSFQSVWRTSPSLQATLTDLERIAASPHLQEPCDGRITCAFIGSSGHGKTTILDEMFPRLAERGWLVTDVTDTTSQSLRISYAPAGSGEMKDVTVRSWNVEQIKDLMRHPEVEAQNQQDEIRVNYLDDGVEVDGTQATFAEADLKTFRFPRNVTLRPFPEPYHVPRDQSDDRGFIRALTVKEQSQLIGTGSVLTVGGRSYDALQLRALVKDVCLKDSFERIIEWSRKDEKDVAGLTFVDTPGLAVNGSVKDEVLRHFLEQKSNHVALQLWKNDELDIIVHLALCGRQSDFAVLWKAMERECGRAAMDDLAGRLVLAVNGMNIYFTNRDIKAKYEDPEVAQREGDHFATTLEDNILQKMCPRGRIQPAKICFLDSKAIVETTTTGPYGEAYEKYRPIMEQWIQPGGVGYDSLNKLGLLEAFNENMAALADPHDRGQGYLVRQIANLVEEQGPSLLLGKYLKRTGLLAAVKELRELLRTYYEDDGSMSREAVRDALKSCLGFLDAEDLTSVEQFASERLDERIDAIVSWPRTGPGRNGNGRNGNGHGGNGHGGNGNGSNGHGTPNRDEWVLESFDRLCTVVRDSISEASEAPIEVQTEFARYFNAKTSEWAGQWGYAGADLPPPEKGFANSAALMTHSMKIHSREMLYQLLVEEEIEQERASFQQDEDDKAQVLEVIRMLDEALMLADEACQAHGVQI